MTGKAEALCICCADTAAAENIASLIDGYCRLVNQSNASIWNTKGTQGAGSTNGNGRYPTYEDARVTGVRIDSGWLARIVEGCAEMVVHIGCMNQLCSLEWYAGNTEKAQTLGLCSYYWVQEKHRPS